jgi:hypothetical protein
MGDSSSNTDIVFLSENEQQLRARSKMQARNNKDLRDEKGDELQQGQAGKEAMPRVTHIDVCFRFNNSQCRHAPFLYF